MCSGWLSWPTCSIHLRIRRNGGSHLAQLPRDVITALVAMVNIRYLLQYMAKMDPDRDPVFALWDYLIAIAPSCAGLRGDFVVAGRWSGISVDEEDIPSQALTGFQHSRRRCYYLS